MGTKDTRDFLLDANIRMRPVPWTAHPEGSSASPSAAREADALPRAHAGFLWRSEHLPVERLYREARAKARDGALEGARTICRDMSLLR